MQYHTVPYGTAPLRAVLYRTSTVTCSVPANLPIREARGKGGGDPDRLTLTLTPRTAGEQQDIADKQQEYEQWVCRPCIAVKQQEIADKQQNIAEESAELGYSCRTAEYS